MCMYACLFNIIILLVNEECDELHPFYYYLYRYLHSLIQNRIVLYRIYDLSNNSFTSLVLKMFPFSEKIIVCDNGTGVRFWKKFLPCRL